MKLAMRLFAVVALVAAAGCAGSLTIDGYEASYVDAPTEYVRSPRYTYRGVDVYEINGRYYREYNRRWVVYHRRPVELRRY